MFPRSTMLLLIVAGSLGCAMKMAPRAEPGAYPDASGASADYDYNYGGGEDESVVATMMEPQAAPPPSRRRFDSRKEARREMASPAPATDDAGPPPPVEASTGASEPERAIEAPEHDPHDRQIIYTATLQVSVFNLDEAMTKAEVLPESYGGYVHSMSQGHLVMRIPSKNLRKAMEDLAALGVVEQRALQAQDVTAEYVDIDARIRVLEETQKQMVELLAKARTVDEALEVRKALDQITMELEVLKGRMRQLQNMISFSTLTVALIERGPHVVTPSSRDPFPWVDDLGVEATEWK